MLGTGADGTLECGCAAGSRASDVSGSCSGIGATWEDSGVAAGRGGKYAGGEVAGSGAASGKVASPKSGG
ncbi:MAG TPA: DUF1566 domain-containing protein, partial [Anaerolineae bacterium]